MTLPVFSSTNVVTDVVTAETSEAFRSAFFNLWVATQKWPVLIGRGFVDSPPSPPLFSFSVFFLNFILFLFFRMDFFLEKRIFKYINLQRKMLGVYFAKHTIQFRHFSD